MICGCCKDLGCFVPEQEIDFGFKAVIADDPYIFHIWSTGGYSTQSVVFSPASPIVLPFQFNENGETTIKIELPADFILANLYQDYGIKFLTSKDGACCFTVHGIIPICQ